MPGSLRRGQKGYGFVLLKRRCGKGNDIGIMLRQKPPGRRQERIIDSAFRENVILLSENGLRELM